MTIPVLSLFPVLGQPFDESILPESFSFTRAPAHQLRDRGPTFMSKSSGIEVSLSPEGVVETIFLHGWGHERYAQYAGQLPESLGFHSTRDEVRRVFGPPQSSGEPREHAILGSLGAWDRYDLPSAHLHFQYRTDGAGIAIVTLMAPGTAP